MKLKTRITLVWGEYPIFRKIPTSTERLDSRKVLHLRRIEIAEGDKHTHTINVAVCDQDWRDAPPIELAYLRTNLTKWANRFRLTATHPERKVGWQFKTPHNKTPFIQHAFRLGQELNKVLGVQDPAWISQIHVHTKWFIKKGWKWLPAEEQLFETYVVERR